MTELTLTDTNSSTMRIIPNEDGASLVLYGTGWWDDFVFSREQLVQLREYLMEITKEK